MYLDIRTLAVVTVFVTALLGTLLLFAGVQNRAVRAPTLWGLSYLLGAVGMALVIARGQVPDWLSIEVANVLVLTGMALVWAGARMFDRRPTRLTYIAVAPALWIAACLVPAIGTNINLRTVVVSVLLAALALLTAREIWRGRAEPLLSRWPTVITLLGYAGTILARAPATLLVPQPLGSKDYIASALFPLLAYGTLVFTVVLAFLLLNMTKERTELQHKIASLIDPLSGVANRRAFLDGADRLLHRQSLDFEPLAVLLFDLDRFKTINDRLGHGTGDTVLHLFASVTARTLGPDVLFGRIGGEEFAAILSVGDIGEAVAIADRVRRNFAGAMVAYGSGDLRATVSVGVTLGCDPQLPVTSLLAMADQALYRAKANGRNRVECSAPSIVEEEPAPVTVLAERQSARKIVLRS